MTKELPRMELITKMIGRSGEELEAIAGQARAVAERAKETKPIVKAEALAKRGAI